MSAGTTGVSRKREARRANDWSSDSCARVYIMPTRAGGGWKRKGGKEEQVSGGVEETKHKGVDEQQMKKMVVYSMASRSYGRSAILERSTLVICSPSLERYPVRMTTA